MTNNCRVSNKPMTFIHDFGKMPIANNFISSFDNVQKEFFFNLSVSFSSDFSLLQLNHHPDVKQMFHKNYAFLSGTSKYMENHFENTKNWIFKNGYLNLKKNKIIEIGSNDGIFLKSFKKNLNTVAIGFEPSTNVYKLSKEKGINAINDFFSYKSVKKRLNKLRNTDVVFAANAFCHIPDLPNLIKGIDLILKENGYLIFEDPYLGAILSKNSYDQIYDEHIFYFSILSVKKIFEKYNFTLVDVLPIDTHGGSMRYIIKKQTNAKTSVLLNKLLDFEKKNKFDDISTYKKFSENCKNLKNKFKSTLIELKNKGKKIYGYGATSKSTTILNYCNIGKDLIDYIIDTTPTKYWKFSPGKHIPILPYHLFKENYPDYFVLFAWNHAKEIKKKEKKFNKIGSWITHLD